MTDAPPQILVHIGAENKAALIELVKSASSTIKILAFQIAIPRAKNSNPVTEIMIALHDAIERGVNVQIIMNRQFGSAFQALHNSAAAKVLSLMGANVRQVKTGRALHSKVFLADEARAYVGSANITNASLNHNHETGVTIQHHPTAQRLEAAFLELWQHGATV